MSFENSYENLRAASINILSRFINPHLSIIIIHAVNLIMRSLCHTAESKACPVPMPTKSHHLKNQDMGNERLLRSRDIHVSDFKADLKSWNPSPAPSEHPLPRAFL